MRPTPGDDRSPVEVKEHVVRGPFGSNVGRTVFRYDAKGREVDRTGYDAHGKVTYRTESVHRCIPEGRELNTTTYRPDGTVWEKSVSRFDLQDRIIEVISMSSDETVIDLQVYTYNDDEDKVSYTHYGKSGKVLEKWTRETD